MRQAITTSSSLSRLCRQLLLTTARQVTVTTYTLNLPYSKWQASEHGTRLAGEGVAAEGRKAVGCGGRAQRRPRLCARRLHKRLVGIAPREDAPATPWRHLPRHLPAHGMLEHCCCTGICDAPMRSACKQPARRHTGIDARRGAPAAPGCHMPLTPAKGVYGADAAANTWTSDTHINMTMAAQLLV